MPALISIILCALGLPATGLAHFRLRPQRRAAVAPRVGVRLQQNDSLPAAINYFASVVHQDKLYVIGGNDNSWARRSDVVVFDGSSWSRAPSMRETLDDCAAAVFRGKLYVAGGFAETHPVYFTVTNTMEVFDGTSWAFAPPMAQARGAFGLVPYKGKLYAVGGYEYLLGTSDQNSQGHALDAVELFDGEVWKWGPSMPAPAWGSGAVVFQDRLVVVGGARDWLTSSTNTMMIFDGASWSFGPPMPISRSYLGAAVFDGKLYAMGGGITCCNDGSASDAVVIFDGVRWTSGQPMKKARTCFRAEVFQGSLLAMGGNSMELLDSMEEVARAARPQRNATEG